MTKKMLIDATHAEETRVVVVDGTKVEDFDFESLNKRQLAGNIYLAKVTRVEPSLQAAFVEYGGNRHGFLAFSEIHPDYYQIPKADREALMAEEAALAREAEEEAARETAKPRGRSRSRKRAAPEAAGVEDATIVSEPVADGDAPAPEAAADLEVAAYLGTATDPGAATDLEDVPPPSAAAGDIEIDVPDEPVAEAAVPADAAVLEDEEDQGHAEVEGYESVGGDDVQEERAPRKPMRQRRYKIQEVIKVRQILLVQVVKEERGNKGAALTTYLSLAGRYCVLMPNTARGGGISRKITNAADRKKLKEISSSITVPEGAGLIIRTAGAARTKTEIKRDYEYLLRQWEQIRDLTLKSIAPAPIYEEGSLIKRTIRDLYSREMDEVLVDGERGYREAKDYMKMLMPSHAKNVKHYADPLPLFSRFQVESYLSAMFNPVVQLKSGGYIVIDVTEALVAIDVNSGRATREASIEETALKTNLEAAEEAARQMRLRDLAGLIVIDFIDMEDRRNNAAVEKKLKDKLKTDRARIQVGRISPFGLLEMSRQRLRPGMIEATTKACPHCHGTGRVRSDDSLALALLREVEEEGVKQRSKEVLIVAPVNIANYLLNQKREHIAMIEQRFGLSVRVEGDPTLISPDYKLERFKTASRIVPAPTAALEVAPITYPTEDEFEEEAEEETAEAAEGSDKPGAAGNGKRKRRRRRRGGKGHGPEAAVTDEVAPVELASEPFEPIAADSEASNDGSAAPTTEPAAEAEPAPRSRSRRRTRTAPETDTESAAEPQPTDIPEPAAGDTSPFGEVIDLGEPVPPEIVEVPEANAPQPRSRPRVRKPVSAVLAEVVSAAVDTVTHGRDEHGRDEHGRDEHGRDEAAVAAPTAEDEPFPAVDEPVPAEDEPVPADPAPEAAAVPEPEPAPGAEPEPEPAPGAEPAPEPEPEPAPAGSAPDEPKAEEGPKRRGWWSRALSS